MILIALTILQVIQSGQGKYNIERIQTNKFGEVTTLLTNKIPLYDQRGNISGIMEFMQILRNLKTHNLD